MSKLKMHQGNALRRIAATYPTVLQVLLESVQNAIDAEAGQVWITVNQKNGVIAVRDDGNGVTKRFFEDALTSVCESKKAKGKLGRFGIGLISPLGKCGRFTFTSNRRGTDEFREWLFVTQDIVGSKEMPDIPDRIRTDLSSKPDQPRGITTVSWSTEVQLSGVTKDAVVNKLTLDELADAIFDKFGPVIARRGIVADIRFVDREGIESQRAVSAKMPTGRPLEEFSLGRQGEKTFFRLYLSRRESSKRRGGKVYLGEKDDDYRITFDEFARSVGDILEKDVVSALASGIFEGEIVSESVQLHASRTQFEQGEGLLKLCGALESWFDKVGKKHLEQAKADKEGERFQRLGLESLKNLGDLLLRDFRQLIDGFKTGTVGSGHAKVPKSRVVGPDSGKTLALNGASHGNGDGESDGGGTPKNEHPEHHPFLASGPKGSVRKVVVGGSTGLKFVYTEMLSDLWYLDTETGELHFNVLHPTWAACGTKDRHVMQLQELIAVTALTLETMPNEWRDNARIMAEDSVKAYAKVIVGSDSFE